MRLTTPSCTQLVHAELQCVDPPGMSRSGDGGQILGMNGEQHDGATLPSCGSVEGEQPGRAQHPAVAMAHDLKRDAGSDHDALQNEDGAPPSHARAHIALAVIHRPAALAVCSRVRRPDPQSTVTARSNQPQGAA